MADLSPNTQKDIMKGFYSCHQGRPDVSLIERIAAELSLDIVYYATDVKPRPPVNRYAVTMRRCVDEMLVKHEILFKGMVNKLHITRENVHLTFTNVVNELFRDGEINWGRIVSVFAFAARLAVHVHQEDQEFDDGFDLKDIALLCGEFVALDLRHWIEKQGGWDSFEKYFPEKDALEKSVWQGLLVTVALGVGALATMAAVR